MPLLLLLLLLLLGIVQLYFHCFAKLIHKHACQAGKACL